jgi:hypothetical protein
MNQPHRCPRQYSIPAVGPLESDRLLRENRKNGAFAAWALSATSYAAARNRKSPLGQFISSMTAKTP